VLAHTHRTIGRDENGSPDAQAQHRRGYARRRVRCAVRFRVGAVLTRRMRRDVAEPGRRPQERGRVRDQGRGIPPHRLRVGLRERGDRRRGNPRGGRAARGALRACLSPLCPRAPRVRPARGQITSKLWGTWHSRVEEGLDQSLQRLGVDYLDRASAGLPRSGPRRGLTAADAQCS
jgi:hypothetical protein